MPVTKDDQDMEEEACMSAPASLRMRACFGDTSIPEPSWPTGIAPLAFDPTMHAQAAHALLEQAYSSGGGSVDGFSTWWESLRQDSEYDPSHCFVVMSVADRRMVGFAQCWTSCWIKDIAVLPAFQRRGIGRALLCHVLRFFQAQHADSVGLSVHADNPSGAVGLYRSVGFRTVSD